jgi:hypothetical protein
LTIKASPGEYEPATFTVKANSVVTNMTVTASNLTSGANTISSSNLDIKVIKVWWQAGNSSVRSGVDTRRLVPELLLNNDDLVTIGADTNDNYLTVTSTAIKISSSAGIGGWGNEPSTDDFPVQDSATFQPVDIASGQQKQFWITAYVPSGTAGGTYTGTITLAAGGTTLKTLNVNLTVYPITLSAPTIENTVFMPENISSITQNYEVATGTLGRTRTRTQYAADLANLYKHGITNPTFSSDWSYFNQSLFETMLSLRTAAGMSNANLYYIGLTPNADVALNNTQRAQAETWKNVAAQYGTSQLYAYGPDETDMTNLRTSIDTFHASSTKIANAQNATQARNIYDKLDIVVLDLMDTSIANTTHSYGNKIYAYGSPQAGDEEPLTYRINYGLRLWQYGYDGGFNYAYMAPFNNIWNDFDNGTYREQSFVYPTANGMIDTVQWEGMREAVDDLKYLATLQSLITTNTASGAHSVTNANNFLTYLRSATLTALDMDVVRQTMVNFILYFLDQGSAPAASNLWSSCGNNTREGLEECDGTELNSKTCTSFGYTGGTLSCRPVSCYFDKSSCTPAVSTIASYDAGSDFNNGYSNRAYVSIKSMATGTADTSAYVDFLGASKTLVARWKFDENSGIDVSDASGNSNNGILHWGDRGTAAAGSTETNIKDTASYNLQQANDAYNGWTFLATSGVASGTTRTVSDYTVTSVVNDRTITLSSALTGFAAGDNYRLYYNASGPSFVAGKFGNAVSLDGLDDYVELGANAPSYSEIAGSALTVSMWIKPSRTTGNQYLFWKNGPVGLYMEEEHLRGDILKGAERESITGIKAISANVWHQVALVYNNGTLYLYLDGVLDATRNTSASALYPDSGCVVIGKYTAGGCVSDSKNYFKGSIDDVMIFKRALVASEIKALYNANIFPVEYQSGTLSDGSQELAVWVTDTTGNITQMATQTIRVASYSSASDLGISMLGIASTSSLKLLAGTVWDRFIARTSSTFDVIASSTKKIDIGINTSLLSLTPSGGEANLYFDSANYFSSDGFVNRWMVSSSVPSTQVNMSIKVPDNQAAYEIKIDGVHYDYQGATANGYINFSYGGGFSTKNFTIQEWRPEQKGYAATTTINGVKVNIIESTSTSTTFTATSTPLSSSTSTPLESAISTFIIVKEKTVSTGTPQETLYIKDLPFPTKLLKNNLSDIQDKLKELEFFPKDIDSTGHFGPLTKKAIRDFQKSVQIFPNGIIGPRTMKALNNEQFITNKDYQFMEELKYGSRGQEVKELQTRLRDQNFFPWNIPSTGYFGPITLKALKIFQSFFNLPLTGIVDILTREALGR